MLGTLTKTSSQFGASSSRDGRLRLALCDSGNDRYLIDFSHVSSIQQSNVITRLPTLDQPDGSLMTAQGDIPVFSLAQRLGGLPSEATRQYCLIVGGAESRWGLLVDRVHHAADCDQRDLVALPLELRTDWCHYGLIRAEDAESIEGDTDSTPRLRLILRVAALHPESGCQSVVDPIEAVVSTNGQSDYSTPTGSRATRQLLSFSLSDSGLAGDSLRIGMSATQVAEILTPPQLTNLPRSAEHILGLVAWRGRAVPVVDIATRLGVTIARRQQPTRLIVARTNNPVSPLVAFFSTTDIRTDRTQFDQARRSEMHSNLNNSLHGAFHLGDSTVLIPDLAKLL
jgi:chemotaxis signal transduction protein